MKEYMYKVNGYYGTRNEGSILVFKKSNGKRWYCVEGSCNVNCTYDIISEGTNVEELQDIDIMTSSKPIETLSELYDFVIS